MRVEDFLKDNRDREGHWQQSVRGGMFSLLARAAIALVQVGSGLFLARLLAPSDYGLVAMVTAVTGFAPLVADLGTRDAIVQRMHFTDGEASAIFWITTGISGGITLLLIACGPLISRFYGEPRLTLIVVVSALAFVGVALTSQHQALLRRAGMFRELAVIEVSANLISACLTLGMACYGLGYWALITRPTTMHFLTAAGVWRHCPWRPRWPTFTTGVREMIKFGIYLIGFSLTDFASRSNPRIAIGRVLGSTMLGYYHNALFIYDNLIDILVMPLHQVAVSALSKLSGKPEELKRAWAKALSSVAFYSMPMFGLLAVTGRDTVMVLLGRKWATAGLVLSVLALRGIPHSIERTMGWLYVAAGRTDRWMRWGVFALCVQLAALFAGLPFGLLGVAAAYVLSAFLLFLPAIAYAGQPLRIGVGDVIGVVGKPMVGSLLSAALCFALVGSLANGIEGVARAVAVGSVYCLLYLVLVVGVMRFQVPLVPVRGFLCDMLPTRVSRLLAELW